ncbi:MAG: YCF48-related protein [Gemmatimonadota bacterium]
MALALVALGATAARAQTWTVRASGTAQPLNDVVFSSAATAVAVGGGGNNGVITVSGDGGASWALNAYAPPGTRDLNAVFSSAGTVVAVGNDGPGGGVPAVVSASNDRGSTFFTPTLGHADGTSMVDVVFSGASTVIAVGSGAFEVISSADRGAVWGNEFNATNDLYAVAASGRLVVAAGNNNAIARSASTGNAWSSALSAGTAAVVDMNDVAFAAPSIVVAVGQGGTVIRSTDGGDRWRNPYSAGAQLNAVAARATRVVAVGNGGVLALSTDFGATWSSPASPTGQNLNDVLFLTSTVVLAAGNNGAIIGSQDGGATWALQTSNTAANLSTLAYNAANRVVAVGAGGVIVLSADQLSTSQPIPFQSKWLLVLLLGGYGAYVLHRML